jgi:hypothetical protein
MKYEVRPTLPRQSETWSGKRPIRTVGGLARIYGVSMDDVRRVALTVRHQPEDPTRERRLEAVARRIAEGSYRVGGDEIADMAVRRALADRTE